MGFKKVLLPLLLSICLLPKYVCAEPRSEVFVIGGNSGSTRASVFRSSAPTITPDNNFLGVYNVAPTNTNIDSSTSNPVYVYIVNQASSTPISLSTMTFYHTIDNGTLGVGTTFYGYITPNDLYLTGVTATLLQNRTTGSTIWKCWNGTSGLSVTTHSYQAIGSRTSTTGAVPINIGEEIVCIMEQSSQSTTPTARLSLQYVFR